MDYQKTGGHWARTALLLALTVFLTLALAGVGWAIPLPTEGQDLGGEIIILHTNDSHGRVSESLGFSAVAAAAQAYRAAGATVLLLDAGDTLHGLPFANLAQGAEIVELMNLCGYDAMAPGNHDFNYGAARLTELAAAMQFPLLAANLYDVDGERPLAAYTLIERGGRRFMIVGFTTPESAATADPAVAALYQWQDPPAAAAALAAEIAALQPDYLIGLCHLGLPENYPGNSPALAAAWPQCDLLIDGHSHSSLPAGQWVGETLIVSAGEYLQQIGVVHIDKNGRLEAGLLTEENFAARDSAVAARIAEMQAEQEVLLSEVLGQTPLRLEGERQIIRRQETNLGNLLCDALLSASGADLALFNSGSIRASIEAGPITRRDVLTVFPFGNTLVTQQVSGETVLLALEQALAGYPEDVGAFPQVGGLHLQFDPARPSGARVFDVEIGGQPLDRQATYLLATNDYLAAGGDISALADIPLQRQYGAVDEIFLAYLLEADFSLYQAPQGRLQTAEAPRADWQTVLWRLFQRITQQQPALALD